MIYFCEVDILADEKVQSVFPYSCAMLHNCASTKISEISKRKKSLILFISNHFLTCKL